MKTEYRDYIIEYNPPPIPVFTHDWAFCHKDFDGAPDSGDYRCGTGEDIEDCKHQIDAMEEEWD